MADEATATPQVESTTAIELWRAFVGALETAGEATLRASARAGAGPASRALEPLFRRTFEDLQQSGAFEVMQEIARLTDLEEDWDGAGGQPATPAALRHASTVVSHVFGAVSVGEKPTWRRPAVSTAGDGGIDLSWIGPARSVLIVIYATPDAETVVCVTQDGDAPPQRVVVPVNEAVEKVKWALGDG
jgi:hypothetical protein